MREIKKVSDITAADIADFLRLEEVTEDETQTLKNLLGIAKKYIESYTGRTEAELDNFSDFVIVAFVLVQDMYDNRTMYVDRNNINRVVETILGMHSVNLL